MNSLLVSVSLLESSEDELFEFMAGNSTDGGGSGERGSKGEAKRKERKGESLNKRGCD